MAQDMDQAQDAVELLMQDHRRVEELVEQFEQSEGDEKQRLAEQIALELRVHTRIEEEIFYPAVREALDDDDMVDEAIVEHDSVKQLLTQIEQDGPQHPLFQARVKVVGELVDHHVEEEEEEMFPQAREAGVDLTDLAARMAARKQELMVELKSRMAGGSPTAERRSFSGSDGDRAQDDDLGSSPASMGQAQGNRPGV
mgnify:CR=1 FL=1